MEELRPNTLPSEVMPTFEQFKARPDATLGVVNGYNNMYFKVMLPQADDEDYMQFQLKGESLSEKIADPEARGRFLSLCKEYTALMRPVMFSNNTQKTNAILSDETNRRLWELYTLGRQHGLTHADLCA